jgi:hypothetical protein
MACLPPYADTASPDIATIADADAAGSNVADIADADAASADAAAA